MEPCRESIIVNIPGLLYPVRVVAARNMRIFPKCRQCKEKLTSRAICRQNHTCLPWKDTYLCITIDETCFERKQSEGNFCTAASATSTCPDARTGPSAAARRPMLDQYYVAKGNELARTPAIDESLVKNATIATESTNKNSDSKITAEIKKDVSYCFEYPTQNKYTDKQLHCTLCQGRNHSVSKCRKAPTHLDYPGQHAITLRSLLLQMRNAFLLLSRQRINHVLLKGLK